MARARGFANVAACRAVSNPAWCNVDDNSNFYQFVLYICNHLFKKKCVLYLVGVDTKINIFVKSHKQSYIFHVRLAAILIFASCDLRSNCLEVYPGSFYNDPSI